jgi:hypothetical protein
MNWKRGFFRVWLVLSVCWLGFWALGIYEHVVERSSAAAAHACFMAKKDIPPPGNPFDCFDGVRGNRFADLIPLPRSISNYVAIALGPPIALLLLGLVTIWVSRGFRRPR